MPILSCSRPISVCHQFLTLVPFLSKLGSCGKFTVLTYSIGFLGMLRSRPRRSSLFFYGINKEHQRGLSHTTGLVNSSALQRCLERLKWSTPGREKRVSLEKSRKRYMAGSEQFRVHRARVISDRSVLLPPAFAARIRMSSHSDAPRSPVVAVCADFSAKVDEEVWSAHERGSGARFLWSQ